ncbi:Protein lsb5 [Psilocybe cubensis]|uniref:VHS domain-containing protein n=2 Tax=Psilocybe cubensis TaxID=181762 RepID=A0A8H7Y5I1_PSICU|nr:Protein lsb5 [Psilocybe cubensis]KAH9486543.1 Protein lsb5 [Psilocybe cubensis]
MSALSFARHAFGREKPHSSITDWVEILTSANIAEEAYDGIPELVDSIKLQASGPAEASRALRKKLKHGNAHQQYRALVILKALVENCGQKFQSTFADGQMTDTIRNLLNDPSTDRRVKKKLSLVLASWQEQYKDDPSMSAVTNLSKPRRDEYVNHQELANLMGYNLAVEEKKWAEEREAKKKKKREKEERARLEAEKRNKKKREPFEFEKHKAVVLASIVDASQASNNLVNAITLVNLDTDSLETNERVQECLQKAKQARKAVLVENEEVIGTLIETNDRLMSAIETYESLTGFTDSKADGTGTITSTLAATTISSPSSNTTPNFDSTAKGKQRIEEHPVHIHPDLEDLSFGALGEASSKLPAPMRPSTLSDDEQEIPDHRGSLSEYSDYESSDEETHKRNPGPSTRRAYVTVSDNEDTPPTKGQARELDPFADPFADT